MSEDDIPPTHKKIGDPSRPDEWANVIDSALPPIEGSPRGFDIRIARDGSWSYRGSTIDRKPLVKLFSSVLRREDDGSYWLVTPAERGRIEVEDVPFVAVELVARGAGRGRVLAFRSNLDEWVEADADHPLRFAEDDATGQPRPYIKVRDGLEARLSRAVFYQLVDLAVDDGPTESGLGVWSHGSFFPLVGSQLD